MRDKLIHEYWGADLEIIWETVNNELPPVAPLIQNILEDIELNQDETEHEHQDCKCE